MRAGEPYVPQGAHQRFLIEAWLFLGKNFPSPPLAARGQEQHGLLVRLISRGPTPYYLARVKGERRERLGSYATAEAAALAVARFGV